MKLIIHRGTNEIGGSCVEFNNGRKRIIFDVGLPLNAIDEDKDNHKNKCTRNIEGYKRRIESFFMVAFRIESEHPFRAGGLKKTFGCRRCFSRY